MHLCVVRKDVNGRWILFNDFYGLAFVLMVQMVAMIYSRYVISAGIIGLAVVSVWRWQITSGSFKIHFRNWRKIFMEKYKEHIPMFLLWGLFFLPLTGLIWSENIEGILTVTRVKLAFLVLPVIFIMLPYLWLRWQMLILYFFIAAAVSSILITAGVAFIQWDEMVLQVKQGQHISIINDHIRYSLILAFASFLCLYLAEKKYIFIYSGETLFLWISAAIIIVGLHVMAIRSGLVALYAAIFTWLVYRSFQKGKFLGLFGFLLGGGILLFIAYNTITPFREKINYTVWNIQQWQQDPAAAGSDAARLRSYDVAYGIIQEQPWTGVGTGDLKAEMRSRYISRYGDAVPPMLSHNQWLTIAAGAGLPVMTITMLIFLLMLFYAVKYKRAELIVLWVIIAISLLVENSFRNSIGVALFSLWWCFLWRYPLRRENIPYPDISRSHPEKNY